MGFWTQWTVSRLAKRRVGMSKWSSKHSIFASGSQTMTSKIWLSHFQASGQPDAKTTEAFILPMEEEYHQ